MNGATLKDVAVLAHLPWVWHWTAAGWAAIATWATFAVAAGAAIYAHLQWKEARATRQEQAQPFVVVDFRQTVASQLHVEIVIENVGTTIAKNVRVVFDPPLQTTMRPTAGLPPLTEATILRSGVPTLPPGVGHRMLFESMPKLYESDLPRKYTATATFEDTQRRHYEMTYELDLDVFFGYSQFTIYAEHDAAKALREIEKTLKKWTAHFNGVRVWTRDEAAYEAELSAEHEQREADRAASTTTDDANVEK